MPLPAEYIFWISLLIVFYTFVGYPLLLGFLVWVKSAFIKRTEINPTDDLPAVTLIISAFNEEDVIVAKIANTDALDYPEGKLNVIFITDGSTDNTMNIVSKHSAFKLLHEPERKGKLAAMNRAMRYVQTGIVVFSDANGFINREAIKYIVGHYANPKVGGVTGEKKIRQDGSGAVAGGEGLYWQYESTLKHLDSRLYTVVGAAGELFSIRTELYTPLPENIVIEDFVQSLLLCKKRYVVRYEPAAYSEEQASGHLIDEMERKIRISAGGFQAIGLVSGLLNLFRYPVVFFQLVSHRLLRWTACPVALLLMPLASLTVYLGTGSFFYGTVTILQLMFYTSALTGWYHALQNKKHRLFYLPFYFLFMNYCVFAGFFRYLGGRQDVRWRKASRA